ncbi:MAG: hypothetical protein IT325_01645 [Anaerolineae bacterium]|nr:hypothetical protein [Anaerolineae bacterium]
MKRLQLGWLVGLVLSVAVLLAGCDLSAPGGASDALSLDTGPDLSIGAAERAARTFLSRWAEGDYAAMYEQVGTKARQMFTADEFTREYENAAAQLTLDSLSAAITATSQQGTTAIIHYDVMFQTRFFGEIADTGRTMRLVTTPEGWRVAWTRMDIFDRLTAGARLERRSNAPSRGNIYDRSGNVLVQEGARSVLMRVAQDKMASVDDCQTLLARLLRREKAEMVRLFARYNPDTVFIAGELDEDIFQRNQAALLSVCDIGNEAIDTAVRTGRRYYNELAPHLVGYVGQIRPDQLDEYTARGYAPDALVGQEGIEAAFEEELAGKLGGQLLIVSPTGELLRKIAEAPSAPGQDVYLTIDRRLQAGVQETLRQAYNIAQPTWAPESPGAAAIVMDVKTGEILAMASYPSYEPGIFSPNAASDDPAAAIGALRNDIRRPMLNRALQGQYSPASVFKIVTMAAALDENIFTVSQPYTCDGTWSNPADVLQVRTDWKPEGHGTIDFKEALTYSCDPYFWEAGAAIHQVDPALITTHAREMGLGVPTGQTLLPEQIGSIPNPDTYRRTDGSGWQFGDTINIAIGQGDIVVTPMQMARMTAAVANNGTLWIPRFVQKVQPPDGAPTLVTEPEAQTQLDYGAEVFEAIREAMCNVTLVEEGTARYIFEEWYEWQGTDLVICGKTGTAQTGGENTPPNAWFVAYAPQDDPEIAVAVIVENSCEGSEVAAPITRAIIEDYYGMPRSSWPELWTEGCIPLGE